MKVLVSAYACEPHKGSEPGVGWNWVKQIARFHEVWVITRANNRKVIEAALAKNPQPNLHFAYVDLPKWMRFWKRGQRGVHLYYYLWQFAAYKKARILMKKGPFDLGHHITFVNDWMPTFLCLLSLPYIWGPIGSHPKIPTQFIPNMKALILEKTRSLLHFLIRSFDPFFYLSAKRAKLIIGINQGVLRHFPLNILAEDEFAVLPAIGIEKELIKSNLTSFSKKSNLETIKILSVGHLIYIKGFHLAIQAFARFNKNCPNSEFIIIGDGMERKRLEKLCEKLRIKEKVKFIGNISRNKVLDWMRKADFFLYPSFEGGGMVVLEAMACGKPIVCLDFGGPGEFVTPKCGIKVKVRTPEQVVNDLASALKRLALDNDLRYKLSQGAKKRAMDFSWDRKGKIIENIYNRALSNRK